MIKRILNQIRKLNEINMGLVFLNSITDCQWLKCKSFSPHGTAANFSFLYILFRVLNDAKPGSILEFGIGQTTLMTTQYASFFREKVRLDVVEGDQLWLNIFEDKIRPWKLDNINFIHCDECDLLFNGKASRWYKDLKLNDKYNLVILDGPWHTDTYSRVGIVNLIPQNTAEDFVIIVDDYNRRGEQQTVEVIKNKLKQNSIQFNEGIYSGSKDQFLLYSEKFAFLKML